MNLFLHLLTEVKVVVVVEAQPEVHAGVAEPRALVRADAIGAPLALLVGAAARHDAPPPEVVDQRRPRRSVQPHLRLLLVGRQGTQICNMNYP